MNFLSDFYQKAKKKLQDWEQPIQKSVTSGFGKMSNGTRLVMDSVSSAPKKFDSYMRSTPDWAQKVDTGLRNFSESAENVPKFDFAEKINNPIGKIAASIPQGIMNFPSTVVRTTLKDYGKTKNTPSYWLKRGAEGASVGVDIGSTIAGGGIAKNLATNGMKQASKASLGQVFKEGAKQGAREGATYGTTQGALSGLQEGDNLKEQGKNAVKSGVMGGVMGTVAGGVLGGAIPAAGHEFKNIKNDLSTLPKSARTTIVPASTEKISKNIVDRQPSMGTFKNNLATGKLEKTAGFDYARKEGMFSYPERKLITPWKPQSKILNLRPGMNIKDVSYRNSLNRNNAIKRALIKADENKNRTPVVSATKTSYEDFIKGVNAFSKKELSSHDAVIAKKQAQARTLINKQIGNQKAGLPVAEKGFMAPSNIQAPVKKPLPSIEEFVNGKAETPKIIFEKPQYNRFQQAAFDKKAERVGALRDTLSYPNELAQIGYKKNEIAKIGQEQADRIIKLANLGFPKNAMPKDLLSDQVNRIIKKGVSWGELKDYYERKNALNTNFLDGIDPKTLQDINPLMVGGRDVYRNFEVAFGANYPKIKKALLDPFDEAKGNLFKEQEILTNDVFENVVKKLGIEKGSALDKAVVAFGEGKISMDKLQQEFPNDWQKVVDADQWFRTRYPELLNELNAVRETISPTHPLYPETSKIIPQRKDYYRHGKDLEGLSGLKNMFESSANIDPALAASSDVTNPKTKWLSFAQKRKGDDNDFGAVEGYLDYIKNHSYAKHIDPFIQRFKGVDDEAKDMLPRGAFSEDNTRRGLAEELSQKLDPVQQITESNNPTQIKQILMDKDVSEQQAEWMSKELANITNYEKTQVFLKNKLKKNTGKQIENLTTPASLAEQSQNKENNFLVFIKNFSRDLAGKTNPVDRGMQENVFGRKALNIVNFANSRFKANAVVGNASSSVAQFFNIQNGVASAGARNSLKGIGQSLAGIFKENTPMQQSAFVRERFFRGYNKFDTGVLNNTKKFAVWMIGVGDEIGTKFIWNSHYQKALSEGIANPVKYADDWTRKLVAGRGIGEVPLIQKSKMFQLVAPFQLEVANQWYALRDIAKNDPRKLVIAKKMLEFSVASYFMNAAAKKVRGSDVSFDPINAMLEAYEEFQNENDKIKGGLKAGGRMAGEVVSNLPLGQTLASAYPESGFGLNKEEWPTISKYTNIPRKDFFGEGDPTRFGTGGLPLMSAIKNPITGLILPYGGKQLEKSYGGAKALIKGYAENSAGNVMTPIEHTPANLTRGLIFGKNAVSEVRDYYDNNGRPLSEQQTEKYKLMGNDKSYFDKIADERKSGKEKEALKIGKSYGAQADLTDDIRRLSNGSIFVKSLDREFKTEKEASLAISIDELEKSDGNFKDLGNIVLRKGDDGVVHPMKKTSFTASILQQKMENQKRNDDLDGWLKTAKKKIDLMTEMMNDPNIDELDKMTIQNDIDAKNTELAKFASYGGFTKPKKGRAPAKLEEKYRYPLVDSEFMKINMLLAGGARKKPVITRRAMPLIKRRLPLVRRTRRR